MDLLEIHRLLEQDVQKLGMFAYKDFEHEEFDLQLNRQIDFIVHGIIDKHFGRTIKVDERQEFQGNQLTLDNLRRLHRSNHPMVLFNDTTSKIVSFPLPATYYHHIRTNVVISYKCWENGKEVTHTEDRVVRITQAQYDIHNHPFHKTGRDSPAGEIIGTGVFVYYDKTFNIDSARLTYIQKPAVVKFVRDVNGDYDPVNSVQCDLDDAAQYVLVNMTSTKIMELIETNQQKIVNSQRETT